MTAREQRRARVLTKILVGELTMAEGGVELGLSERQLWRLRAAFVGARPAGLVHGNRGRASPQRIDPDRRARIVELRERYGPLNDTHFGELLAEREGIAISREGLRSILRSDGIASPRRRPSSATRRTRRATSRSCTRRSTPTPAGRDLSRRAQLPRPVEPASRASRR